MKNTETKPEEDKVQCEYPTVYVIAAGLSPFAPETQNMRAGRLLLTKIKELTASKENCGFETTLSLLNLPEGVSISGWTRPAP